MHLQQSIHTSIHVVKVYLCRRRVTSENMQTRPQEEKQNRTIRRKREQGRRPVSLFPLRLRFVPSGGVSIETTPALPEAHTLDHIDPAVHRQRYTNYMIICTWYFMVQRNAPAWRRPRGHSTTAPLRCARSCRRSKYKHHTARARQSSFFWQRRRQTGAGTERMLRRRRPLRFLHGARRKGLSGQVESLARGCWPRTAHASTIART